jgi:ADP-heptose:LPS heptosyltransferase
MKILIIRLSSIGDIVLTTSVVRCIAQQNTSVEIHYLCKSEYKNLLENNPFIHKLHLFSKDDVSLLQSLTEEHFDYVVDLQNNYRSNKLGRQLHVPRACFPKLNVRKWMSVNLKLDCLPSVHVVDRYFKATKILPFPVRNDNRGSDFFINPSDYDKLKTMNIQSPFVTIAMGSRHKTKQLPLTLLETICKKITATLVLLGGKEDVETAEAVCTHVADKSVVNLCGKLSLRETAACISLSEALLTGDTGLMHIAAALNKSVVSVWGNTIPAFGMYPYMPMFPNRYHIVENKSLKCRPCSKLGFDRCPRKHFRCMNEINAEQIVTLLNETVQTH